MGNFFEELKRRNVFRVGIAYAVVGWLMIEVVDTIAPRMAMPEWVPGLVIILVLVGLPITLFLAWAFEMTPEGVKKTEDVDAEVSTTRSTGQKLNYLIIGGLVLAVGFLLYDRGGVAPPEPVRIADIDRPTIAVLPFANMSNDPEQEFFSDGITEEILNMLVKERALKVVSRTSAFSFKNQSLDIPTIATQLGAAYVVEGSVRRSGQTLRITAQLIEAATDTHLWSDTYDREMTDVFAIQDEIATAIAGALTLSLGLGEGQTLLVADRISNIAAYESYLKARLLTRGRGADNLSEALTLLRTVTESEPDYAPAWAAISLVYHLLPYYLSELDGTPLDWVALQYSSEQTARRAVSLNPNLATARHALANALRWRHQWAAAEDEYLEARRLDPESVEIIEDHAEFLQGVGRIRDSVPIAEEGLELEPSSAFPYLRYIQTLMISRQPEQAVETILRVRRIYPEALWTNSMLVETYLELGQLKNALAAMQGETNPVMLGPRGAKTIEVLGAAIDGDDLGRFADDTRLYSFDLAIVHLIGGDELVLDDFEQRWLGTPANFQLHAVENGNFMDSVRSHERYKQLVTQLGLVDYWRARGWPDYCHPLSDYDFECGAFE